MNHVRSFLALCRTCLEMLVNMWWCGSYLLEQPTSSLMPQHPRVAELGTSFKVNTYLGAWNHWSPKLTSFFSNQPLGSACAHVCGCQLSLALLIDMVSISSGPGWVPCTAPSRPRRGRRLTAAVSPSTWRNPRGKVGVVSQGQRP